MPIEDVKLEVDTNELNEYSLQAAEKAENSEPDEPVVFPNSAP